MDDKVLNLLRKTNSITENSHFVGTSGRHFATYLNKDSLYPHTDETSQMAELFAENYQDANIEIVVGPALGGIILSTWVAHHLSKLTGREVLGIYTEKDAEKNQVFTRGYDKYVKGKNILVVEDFTTTGGSVKKTVNSVKNAGGNIVSVCVMVNRDPKLVTAEFMGAPFESLAVYEVPSYTAEECPLCKESVPINTSVGHGKKFLEEKANKDL